MLLRRFGYRVSRLWRAWHSRHDHAQPQPAEPVAAAEAVDEPEPDRT